MQTELEAKFLDIQPDAFREKLKSLGAVLVHPERFMKRKVFDFPDERLQKIGGWIRVRDESDKITLSYKQVDDRTLHGTKEVIIMVDDFEKTGIILEKLGLKNYAYQETKREKWICGDCEITIDTWPWIPAFVEIEGPSEELLKSTAEKLGLSWKDALYGSVENAYQKHYDITEAEIDHWESITFIPVPEWLEEKRRNVKS